MVFTISCNKCWIYSEDMHNYFNLATNLRKRWAMCSNFEVWSYPTNQIKIRIQMSRSQIIQFRDFKSCWRFLTQPQRDSKCQQEGMINSCFFFVIAENFSRFPSAPRLCYLGSSVIQYLLAPLFSTYSMKSHCFRLKLTFSCMMELNKYPLDDQTCTMEIASCK